VGTLWLVFAIGGGRAGEGVGFWNPMTMDSLQKEEVFLTAAQSIFAVAVISSLSLNRWEALALLLLFSAQFAIPDLRNAFAVAYIVLAIGLFAFSRETRLNLWDSMKTVFGRGSRRVAERGS
jgi:cation:H+ antiporter